MLVIQKMLNLADIEFKKFPGGELHITSAWAAYQEECPSNVVAHIQSSDDLMKLCLFTNACQNLYGEIPTNLVVPYIPYARQDRIANFGEALSIKVFANILNSLNYKNVYVFDPHSDVSTALINNVRVITQDEIWGTILDEVGFVDLISPDAGALKKIYKVAENLSTPHIRVGTKHRDTQTGKITHTTVDGQPVNKVAYIIDDICDGGRTFIEAAKVVRDQYEKIVLCVTHGIFSNGFEELVKYFDEIKSLNTWNRNLNNPFVKVYKVEQFLSNI